jgi:hypothetical protein
MLSSHRLPVADLDAVPDGRFIALRLTTNEGVAGPAYVMNKAKSPA